MAILSARRGSQPTWRKCELYRQWQHQQTSHSFEPFYYQQFIPAFTKIAAPLYMSLNSKPFQGITWTKQCNTAFNNLKAALTSAPVLMFPDFSAPFYLYTNTSKAAIGAVLAQKDTNRHKHIVAYTSHQLSKSKKNYSITKWECLSIIYWIKYFHQYLHSSKFYIMTDHTALQWLMEAKEQQGRLACWAMKLQPYKFKIQYHTSKLHSNTDTMSQLPTTLANADMVCVLVEPQAPHPQQAAAVKGHEFIQQVTTNPYSNQAARAQGPSQTTVAPQEHIHHKPEWPLEEDWERTWPAKEDWFTEVTCGPTT